MFHQGWRYHGHVSARIPGTRQFFIKPVLAPLGSIAARDIIKVDIDEYKRDCEQNWAKAGNKREVTRLKAPPRETMIHAAIYEARPDVNSVVHTHQPGDSIFRCRHTDIAYL
jgi:ribulose-5-phosphate 4-epimerase/fuculose-1-phosphate aldolase